MPEAGSAAAEPAAASGDNRRIAGRLREFAALLEAQQAEGFRVRAYRAAAQTLEEMEQSIAEVFRAGGRDALEALPAIGPSIATAVAEMLASGGWRQLDRLRGDLTSKRLFATLPGLGPVLAERLADEEDCETLEDLERLLSDPRNIVTGIGPRRRAALLAVLGERLSRLRRTTGSAEEPDVATLLEADRLYRERAAAGRLRRIAPKRFNPAGEAWLPILHARRGPWHFTALFSNSALAHRLDRCSDWVVLYFHQDAGPELRRTVVTETRGALTGQRVVRGREGECARHYAQTEEARGHAQVGEG